MVEPEPVIVHGKDSPYYSLLTTHVVLLQSLTEDRITWSRKPLQAHGHGTESSLLPAAPYCEVGVLEREFVLTQGMFQGHEPRTHRLRRLVHACIRTIIPIYSRSTTTSPADMALSPNAFVWGANIK